MAPIYRETPRLSAGARRIACCLLTLIGLLAPLRASAIPAFARRYQTSCTTCHVIIPRLNAFGVAFRNNGYRIPPHDEDFVKVPDVSLGAPAWKRVWPEAVWPGGIPGVAPIALRMFHDVMLDPGETPEFDFVFPREFEILGAGTAGSGVSYFAELEILPGQDVGADRVSMERMFVQFDRLGGTTLANLIIGRFEIRAAPFSRYHHRLTPSDYLAMDFRSPSDGLHLRRAQAGLEFWGARSGPHGRGGVEYAVGIVNGTGPQPDHNTAKDVYSRLAWKFGGMGVTGSAAGNAAPPPEYSRENSLRVGVMSYFGTGEFDDGHDRFWRLGGDANASLGRLALSAVGIRGRDRFRTSGTVTRFTALSVEADFLVWPWMIPIARFDAVWREEAADIHRLSPALAIAVRANVRVVTEWQAFLETSHGAARAPSGNSQGRMRLDIAF